MAAIAGRIALRSPDVPIADAIITAIAIAHANGVVVTDDPHFRDIKGVRVEWLRAL